MSRKGKQPVEQPTAHAVEDKENELPTTARLSKFKEDTMDSTKSVHPPPEELWKTACEDMLDLYQKEAKAPAWSAATDAATATNVSAFVTAKPAVVGRAAPASYPPRVASESAELHVSATEGPLARLSRALASWFNGAGASFSSLGKRKAGSETVEDKAQDERKKQIEEAYRHAKEQGLLPTPKVFVRPVSRVPKTNGSLAPSVPATPTPNGLLPPRSPALYKTPSKRDLQKQKKLSKRVSDLEYKLQEAKKELELALSPYNPHPVPALPTLPSANFPPTPKNETPSKQPSSTNENTSHDTTDTPSLPPKIHRASQTDASPNMGKIVKKRKANDDSVANFLADADIDADADSKTAPVDSDYSHDSEHESKKTKTTPPHKVLRKKSPRTSKKKSSITQITNEEVLVVVPDGVAVPPIPNIPSGVSGKRAAVSDDGYGGYGDEMF